MWKSTLQEESERKTLPLAICSAQYRTDTPSHLLPLHAALVFMGQPFGMVAHFAGSHVPAEVEVFIAPA
jgi:hypothetical protein